MTIATPMAMSLAMAMVMAVLMVDVVSPFLPRPSSDALNCSSITIIPTNIHAYTAISYGTRMAIVGNAMIEYRYINSNWTAYQLFYIPGTITLAGALHPNYALSLNYFPSTSQAFFYAFQPHSSTISYVYGSTLYPVRSAIYSSHSLAVVFFFGVQQPLVMNFGGPSPTVQGLPLSSSYTLCAVSNDTVAFVGPGSLIDIFYCTTTVSKNVGSHSLSFSPASVGIGLNHILLGDPSNSSMYVLRKISNTNWASPILYPLTPSPMKSDGFGALIAFTADGLSAAVSMSNKQQVLIFYIDSPTPPWGRPITVKYTSNDPCTSINLSQTPWGYLLSLTFKPPTSTAYITLFNVTCSPDTAGFNCSSCSCPCSNTLWSTGQCLTCPSHTYDPTCSSTCDCLNGICSDGPQGTGQCTCNPGFYGPSCSSPCPCQNCYQDGSCNNCSIHQYGPNCSSCLCQNGTCNSTTGYCSSCNPGYFGKTCSPCTCLNGACDDGVDGSGQCTSCLPGYYGPTCDQQSSCLNGIPNDGPQGNAGCIVASCFPGFYGFSCNYRSHCLNGLCHPNSGYCITCLTDSTAKSNWTGEDCGFPCCRAEGCNGLPTDCQSAPLLPIPSCNCSFPLSCLSNGSCVSDCVLYAHNCQQICLRRLPVGFKCACRDGFYLDPDGVSCKDCPFLANCTNSSITYLNQSFSLQNLQEKDLIVSLSTVYVEITTTLNASFTADRSTLILTGSTNLSVKKNFSFSNGQITFILPSNISALGDTFINDTVIFLDFQDDPTFKQTSYTLFYSENHPIKGDNIHFIITNSTVPPGCIQTTVQKNVISVFFNANSCYSQDGNTNLVGPVVGTVLSVIVLSVLIGVAVYFNKKKKLQSEFNNMRKNYANANAAK